MADFLARWIVKLAIFAVVILVGLAIKLEIALPLHRHWNNDYSDCWKIRKLPDGETKTFCPRFMDMFKSAPPTHPGKLQIRRLEAPRDAPS